MKKTSKQLVVLLLAVAFIFSLAACSDSSGESSDTSSEETVLRIGADGEPSSLSAMDAQGTNGAMFVGWCLYDTLWKVTTSGEMKYCLAESYDMSEDGTTITIHLRDNTGFSNGDPVTAADVLFSLRLSDEQTGDRTAAIDLDASYAKDDTTLILTMKYATATLVDDLGMISIMSESWTENYTNEEHIYNDILGCGPYMLEESWSTGNSMILVKNPYYFYADELSYDKIEISFVDEETTRYLSFSSGSYDICYLSDSENIDSVKNDSTKTLFEAPIQFVAGLIWNTTATDSEFTNNNLRLALCYAVDVDAVVSSVCGDAYTAATSFIPSSSWAYKNTAYGYDAALAKEYYDAYKQETGNGDFTFTVTVNDSNINKGLAEAIQYYYSQIGITMNIETLDMASYFGGLMDDSLYCTITQYSGSSDPGSVLNSWRSTSIYQLQKTSDEIMPLLDEATTSLDSQETRTEMFYQVQDLMKDYAKILPLYESTINYALNDSSIDISQSVQADGYLFPTFITISK